MITLGEIPFLKKILKLNNLKVVIEDRTKLKNAKTYQMNNHAEFINYFNPYDKCLWDAIIPGYRDKFVGGSQHRVKKIIGVYLLKNGNHKVAIQIDSNKNYDIKKALKDTKRYITNYKKQIPVYGKWILVDGFD